MPMVQRHTFRHNPHSYLKNKQNLKTQVGGILVIQQLTAVDVLQQCSHGCHFPMSFHIIFPVCICLELNFSFVQGTNCMDQGEQILKQLLIYINFISQQKVFFSNINIFFIFLLCIPIVKFLVQTTHKNIRTLEAPCQDIIQASPHDEQQ